MVYNISQLLPLMLIFAASQRVFLFSDLFFIFLLEFKHLENRYSCYPYLMFFIHPRT